jgi:hypothetical protein
MLHMCTCCTRTVDVRLFLLWYVVPVHTFKCGTGTRVSKMAALGAAKRVVKMLNCGIKY